MCRGILEFWNFGIKSQFFSLKLFNITLNDRGITNCYENRSIG